MFMLGVKTLSPYIKSMTSKNTATGGTLSSSFLKVQIL
ncbi:hypothetical protein D048_1438 [Vibrio parahaemolyticus VPTS-2009]|nr:hypothetical protein D048_1438 [Vibrio parahaemolyticus VPTS-2009]